MRLKKTMRNSFLIIFTAFLMVVLVNLSLAVAPTILSYTLQVQGETATTANTVTYSPNGNSVKDTVDIDLEFDQSVSWEIKIEDNQNNIIREWTGTSANPTAKKWCGGTATLTTGGCENEDGITVSDGSYTIEITYDTEEDTTKTIILDATAPTTTANPIGGTYTSVQSATLTADETATIYYTTNGTTPTNTSSVYSSALSIVNTTTLKFFAVDSVANTETIKTQTYTININELDLINLPSTVNMIEDDSKDVSFTVKNTGTTTLNGITFTQENADLTDDDDNTITLTFAPLTITTLSAGASQTVNITIDSEKDQMIGSYSVVIKTNDANNLATDSFTLSIEVNPDFCEEGEVGKIEITDFDLDEDELDIGDTIVIDITVKNDYSTKDVEDIFVEAFLYDITDGDELESTKSERFDLDNGDDKDLTMELDIPYDVNEENDFLVYVIAYEDKNEEENCAIESTDITINRQKNDVKVEGVKFTPAIATPGETVEIEIEVQNIGTKDQDDVTVAIYNTQLGINAVSDEFNLDRFDDNGDSAVKRFEVKIPLGANSGDYTIEIRVKDEGGSIYDSGETLDKKLTVSTTITTTGAATISTPTLLEAELGRPLSVPVTVKNAGESATYTIEVTPSWSGLSATKVATLMENEENTFYVTLPTDTMVGGGYATVNLKDEEGIVASKTISVNVKTAFTTGATGAVTYSVPGFGIGKETLKDAFWIVGDVALLLLTIYVLKLLFFKRPKIRI